MVGSEGTETVQNGILAGPSIGNCCESTSTITSTLTQNIQKVCVLLPIAYVASSAMAKNLFSKLVTALHVGQWADTLWVFLVS